MKCAKSKMKVFDIFRLTLKYKKNNFFIYFTYLFFSIISVIKEIGLCLGIYFGITYFLSDNLNDIYFAAISLILSFFGSLCNFIIDYYYNKLDYLIEIECRKELNNIIQNANYSEIINKEYMSSLNDLIENYYYSISSLVFDFMYYFRIIIICGFYVFVSIYFGEIYSIIAVVLSFVISFLIYFFDKKEYKNNSLLKSKILPKKYFNNLIFDRILHREIKYNNAKKYLSDSIDKVNLEYEKEFNNKNKYNSSKKMLVIALQFIFWMVNFIFIIIDKGFDINSTNVYTIITMSTFYAYLELTNIYYRFSYDKEAIYHINNYFILNKDNNVNSIHNIDIENIKLNNVYFSYDTRIIIDNIFLELKKGNTYLFVGSNGCGKTTLCSIIGGFLKPQKGDILINNSINFNIMSEVGYLSQDFPIIKMSIRDNMLGNYSDNEIFDVLKLVGLENKIKSLKKGLDTSVGEIDDDYTLFSKGEWQRFCLARLLLKKDKKIWILDEPTSSLDAFMENNLLNIINNYKKDKIIIIVSHRLIFAKNADQIIGLENGKIKFIGNHNDLMENNYYNKMYSLQKNLYLY